MAISARELEQKQRVSARRLVYPERDGKPMGETERHIRCLMDAISELDWHFRDRQDVYIAGNNFIYYEEGNPRARVSPDTYVVFGIPKGIRDTYFTWKNEGRTPDVVIEFTSRKTRSEDHGRKKDLYEKRFGVAEYFIFDPRAEYQRPRLKGFRLHDGEYVEIELVNGRMYSEQLGLELVVIGDRLRFYDPVRNRFLPRTLDETQRANAEAERAAHEAERAAHETERAEREAESRQLLEAEVERLRAEIEALKRERNG